MYAQKSAGERYLIKKRILLWSYSTKIHHVHESYHILQLVDVFAMLKHRRSRQWQCRKERCCIPTARRKYPCEEQPEQVLHHHIKYYSQANLGECICYSSGKHAMVHSKAHSVALAPTSCIFLCKRSFTGSGASSRAQHGMEADRR